MSHLSRPKLALPSGSRQSTMESSAAGEVITSNSRRVYDWVWVISATVLVINNQQQATKHRSWRRHWKSGPQLKKATFLVNTDLVRMVYCNVLLALPRAIKGRAVSGHRLL